MTNDPSDDATDAFPADQERDPKLADDEFGLPATQATGGLVPDGAEDDQP